MDDGVLLNQNWERFEGVMASKVAGSWNLHLLTKDMPLDFLVFFSSMASLMGSPGQGNYAAANAFLDGLAHYRRTKGQPVLSVNRGPWRDVGVAAKRRAGAYPWLGTIAPSDGTVLLEQLLEQDEAQIAVARVGWSKLFQSIPASSRTPLLAELERETQGAVKSEERTELVRRVEAAAPPERVRILTEHVRDQAVRVLGIDTSQSLNVQQPLADLGLDSLMALELTESLRASTGQMLPATLLFSHPTVDALACRLIETMSLDSPAEAGHRSSSRLGRSQDSPHTVAQLSETDAEIRLIKELDDLHY